MLALRFLALAMMLAVVSAEGSGKSTTPKDVNELLFDLSSLPKLDLDKFDLGKFDLDLKFLEDLHHSIGLNELLEDLDDFFGDFRLNLGLDKFDFDKFRATKFGFGKFKFDLNDFLKSFDKIDLRRLRSGKFDIGDFKFDVRDFLKDFDKFDWAKFRAGKFNFGDFKFDLNKTDFFKNLNKFDFDKLKSGKFNFGDFKVDMNKFSRNLGKTNFKSFKSGKFNVGNLRFDFRDFLEDLDKLDWEKFRSGKFDFGDFKFEVKDFVKGFDKFNWDNLRSGKFDLGDFKFDLDKVDILKNLDKFGLDKLKNGKLNFGDFKIDLKEFEKDIKNFNWDRLKSGKIDLGDFKIDLSKNDFFTNFNKFDLNKFDGGKFGRNLKGFNKNSKKKEDNKIMKDLATFFALALKIEPLGHALRGLGVFDLLLDLADADVGVGGHFDDPCFQPNTLFLEGSISAKNEKECQKLCRARHDCRFYTYSLSTKGCGIRTFNPSSLLPMDNFRSGLKNLRLKHRDDFILVGYLTDAKSMQHCQASCEDDEQCRTWSYYPGKKECVHNYGSAVRTLDNVKGVVSGKKHCALPNPKRTKV